MIDNSTLFHTFSPCSGNYMVQIADGLVSKVVGMATIIVTKDSKVCTFGSQVNLQFIVH